MDASKYLFQTLFARDIILKMSYQTSFDIVKLTKVTVQYSSKYMLTESQNILLPSGAIQNCTGQMPYLTRAKYSVAAFKLKEKQVLGCAVTLRKEKMHHFFTHSVKMLLPRTKELTSLPVSPVQRNVHFGIVQLLFFPSLEQSVDVFESLEGCSVHVHTSAKEHVETLLLCTGLRLPVYDYDEDLYNENLIV
jgi:large subunit ribosomal protein L5